MNTFSNPEVMLRIARLKNSEDIARAARHRRAGYGRSRSAARRWSRRVTWLTDARRQCRLALGRAGRRRPLWVAVLVVGVTTLATTSTPATSAIGLANDSTVARAIGMLDLSGITTREVVPTETIPTGLRFVITMAIAGGRLWAASPDGLVAIDPSTNQATLVSDAPAVHVSGEGDTLVRSVFDSNTVEKWNARTGQLDWTADTGAPTGSAIVGGEIWVANHHAGMLSILRTTDGALIDRVKVGSLGDGGPATPVYAQGAVWVTDYRNHRFIAIDVATRRVTARVQVPTAVKFCDQPLVATAAAVWNSDCTSLVTRVDIARREAATVGTGTYAGSPLALAGEVWVPIDGRFVHLRDDLTADRAVSVTGQPYVFGGVVAFNSVWVNAGFGTIVRLPSPDVW